MSFRYTDLDNPKSSQLCLLLDFFDIGQAGAIASNTARRAKDTVSETG